MTIKQLADELGLSKTAIRKKMTEEFRASYVTNDATGTMQISEEGCKLLREQFRKPAETIPETAENSRKQLPETPQTEVFALIEMLQNELKIKNDQITELNARLAETTAALTETTKSLQAAQALHAGTIQQQLLEESTENSSQEQPKTDKKQGFFRRLFHGRKDN